ncbi:MAG: thioredoxin domain-containing protein [Candidatus Micrarchaeota archaeon]|nr:thioredoxin domain-containing protein [Candidatus Micrarchaeota archaeon]
MRYTFTIAAIALAFVLLLAGCAATPLKEGVAADGRPYRGAANAKLTIYEYSDFECPFCARAVQTVEDALRTYPDSVKLEYRYFPLVAIHPRGYPSALAGACAEKQGKFWAMHDLMFANQEKLEDADLQGYAKQAGLDMQQFSACLSSPETAKIVNDDMAAGEKLGIGGTPVFFIGQSSVTGSQPLSKFKEVIDSELARSG